MIISPIHLRNMMCHAAFAGMITIGMLLIAGCGAGNGDTTILSSGTTQSQLYVSSNGSDELLVYGNANDVSGNTTPNRVVSGGLTALNSPRGIAVDMARNQIYVANSSDNAILVFNNTRTMSGNIAPVRMIAGVAMTLSGPSALSFDVFNDQLYVANTADNSILVFDNVSMASGDVPPSRTLKGVATLLNAPYGVFVDTTRNKMYVINGGLIGAGANSILVFDGAMTVSGNSSPARTISGAATTMNSPSGGALDVLQDRLYVANTGSSSILIFNAISTISGNKAPDRALAGVRTALNQPRDLYLDLTGDRLYVANAGGDIDLDV